MPLCPATFLFKIETGNSLSSKNVSFNSIILHGLALFRNRELRSTTSQIFHCSVQQMCAPGSIVFQSSLETFTVEPPSRKACAHLGELLSQSLLCWLLSGTNASDA